MIRLLLENRADVNRIDQIGNTPLITLLCLGGMVAASLQAKDGGESASIFPFVELLLDHGADANA